MTSHTHMPASPVVICTKGQVVLLASLEANCYVGLRCIERPLKMVEVVWQQTAHDGGGGMAADRSRWWRWYGSRPLTMVEVFCPKLII